MTKEVTQAHAVTDYLLPPQSILRRQCACGNHTVAGGECTECGKDKAHSVDQVNQASPASLPTAPLSIQPQLMVGPSSDPAEQEADRAADRITTIDSSNDVAPLRQSHNLAQTSSSEPAPESVGRVLSRSGSKLDPPVQRDMESRFGQDFSRVRVHVGSEAEQSTRDVRANAFTVGNDIVFGPGKFSPTSQAGRRLLAHELTHVTQQSGGLSGAPHSHTNLGAASSVRVARQNGGAAPKPAGPTVTPAIEARLIQELLHARIQAPPSGSIRQESVRTFAVAAIISPDGSVTYDSAYFDKGTDHAEPQLLAKIQDKIKPGDTVAIAVDQAPCPPSQKNCQGVLKQFRTDPQHGSLRVYTVRAMRKDAPPTTTPQTATKDQVVSPKTAIQRPIEQRFLMEEKELRRIRLPIYKEPTPVPGTPGSAGPAGPVTPQTAPPATGAQPPPASAQPPSGAQPASPGPVSGAATPLAKAAPTKAPATGAATLQKIDPKKALQNMKTTQTGGGFKATIKTAAGAAGLDFLINLLKGYMSQLEIQQKTEAQVAALHPQIEAMLATSPKQIHAVIHVFVWTVTRDIVSQTGVEERQGIPMVTVSAKLSETAVAPVSSSRTELLTMGSIQYNSSEYSILLIDVEKELARQEVERKEEQLKSRLRDLARESPPPPSVPAAPKVASPPSLLPPQEQPPAPLLPGAPGPSPSVDQEARAANSKTVGDQLLAEGTRLRNTGASTDDREKFKRKVQVWRGLVQKMIRDFANYKAVESLTETLARFDERMNSLGSELGIDGWRD